MDDHPPPWLPTLHLLVPVKTGRNWEMKCFCSWDRESGQSRRTRLVGSWRGSPAAPGASAAGRHRQAVAMMARTRPMHTFTFMAVERLSGEREQRGCSHRTGDTGSACGEGRPVRGAGYASLGHGQFAGPHCPS